jgi:hypothetical protein
MNFIGMIPTLRHIGGLTFVAGNGYTRATVPVVGVTVDNGVEAIVAKSLLELDCKGARVFSVPAVEPPR